MSKNNIEKLAKFDSEYLSGRSYLVGVDEAGRGSLAGGVCAAAFVASEDFYSNANCLKRIELLDDSKKLTLLQRDSLFATLQSFKDAGVVDFEVAFASVEEIERHNILEATKMAMKRALDSINERRALRLKTSGVAATLFGESSVDLSRAQVLVDGRPLKNFAYSHLAIVKGDSSSLAIAAASIVAKVTRDRYMDELALKFTPYGFEKHKGYGTAAHLQALLLYGACSAHRPSFLKKLRGDSIKDEQAQLF